MAYYYLYQITNNLNGMVYVGMRTSKKPIEKDSYWGSGKRIKRAIKKYGIENFTKTILSTHNTLEELALAEKKIVTKEFVEREDTYNIALGGVNRGSLWDDMDEETKNEARRKISEKASSRKRESHSDETKNKMSQSAKNRKRDWENFKGARKIMAEGVLYLTTQECCRKYGISAASMRKRVKSTAEKWKEFYYV
ncbi:homing endonuclease [Escherichia phage ECD7]|uniref:Homing endonuclease n=1 Tax=Escherichia phage ECD7 TaxID=1981499 RepID=A0A220NTI4_9CAUD|nr:homing endonuclease [Escherichia phage ECD7]ASJ80240.1 homing endonuclease [Escherichia phage ECD7]